MLKMLKRQCEKCKTLIDRGIPFMKVCLAENMHTYQKLTHEGDLCKTCWDAIKTNE